MQKYIATGVIAALLCWAGGYVLPHGQIAATWPGVALGLALFVLGVLDKRIPRSRMPLSAILLIVFTVAGWRLAVDVGYMYGKPVPFVVAGAMGAFCVSIGLLLTWRPKVNYAKFVFLVTVFGALGGFIFRFIDYVLGTDSNPWWPLLLFLEWQTVLLFGIWLVLARKSSFSG